MFTEKWFCLLTYINDVQHQSNNSDFLPDTDESFKPSGAVTDMFKDLTQDKSPLIVTIAIILSKQHQNSVLNVDQNKNRIIIKISMYYGLTEDNHIRQCKPFLFIQYSLNALN